MHKIAMATTEERIELSTQTAAKTGLSATIVEKDFWVCWTLDYLFSRCSYKDSFAFKGGTSLWKAFGLIERFSEDIDLIFDWRMLGYGMDEPWEPRSNTKQDAFVEMINTDAGIFLHDTLKPLLETDFKNDINGEWTLQIEERDPQTLCFHYPHSFADDSILQEIRLETGALAAWTPTTQTTIRSYVAEQFPDAMDAPCVSVRTVSAERTFWEKATILHKEAFRTNGRLPDRYSRHYYDIYRMCQTDVKDKALGDLSLMKQVVEFKMRFWRSNVARYDLCKLGTMRLMPPKDSINRIRDDYARMRNMLFGDVPTFDEVMDSIAVLEAEINAL